jgi:tRNA U34 5-carboxymethylaminomethyl modifying GTPase MnmE/TrmE
MNELEQLMQVVQIYIYKKTGKKTRIYLRNIRDINLLKQAYEYIQKNEHNKNTNN